MDLDLVLLGTAASMPTARRSTASILIRRGGERMLLDCGEGTQRQLLRSGIGLVDVSDVFLTHYHADHYLGLPGLLKTYSLRGRTLPVSVYGPPGLRELFSALRRVFGKLTYPLVLEELRPGDAVTRPDYRVVAFKTHHDVPAQGYAIVEEPRPGRFDVESARALGVPEGPLYGRLQRGESIELDARRTVRPEQVLGPARPGRRIVVTGDTRPVRSVLEVANEADVLVHDATFGEEERERAAETGHSTAVQAAELARLAAVRLLVLTHVSSRYFGPELAREARAVFSETVVPRDFDIIDVRFPERGGPRLVKGGALGTHEEGQAHVPDGAGGDGERSRRGGGDPGDPPRSGDPVGSRAGS
jgi:ribonuclease Z